VPWPAAPALPLPLPLVLREALAAELRERVARAVREDWPEAAEAGEGWGAPNCALLREGRAEAEVEGEEV
jgi:hypothetical protein